MLDLKLNNQPITAAAHLREWQPAEFSCVPPPDCTLALVVEGPQQAIPLEPFLHPGDLAWRWRWNPRNNTGRFGLTLRAFRADGVEVAQVHATLDVLPAKIDQHHYEALLNDVQRVASMLAHTLTQSSAGVALRPSDQESMPPFFSPGASCHFYEQRVAKLERLVHSIARQPHHALRQYNRHVPLEQARDMADIVPRDIALDGTAVEVRQSSSVSSTDTYENRLLKHLIAAYSQRVLALVDMSSTAPALTARCVALRQRLQRLLRLPFLADVGKLTVLHGASQVIRHDSRYRQVYQLWQELRRYPIFLLKSPLFHLPVHDLPRLYECWCVLQVARALLDMPGVFIHQQRLVMSHSSNAPYACEVTLNEDTPLLELVWQGAKMRLRYQPHYRPDRQALPSDNAPGSLDTHTHIPDLALEWQHPAQPPRLLVFDAKYRLDVSGGVPRDALADAYTYLGSIGMPDGTRVVRAALLLYPGQGHPEHHASGTGTFPLLPGQVASFRAWLQQALSSPCAL